MIDAKVSPTPESGRVGSKLKGPEVQARRRKEHYDAVFRHIFEWWKAGMSREVIANRLNNESGPLSLNYWSRPWTGETVRLVIKGRADEGEYATLAESRRLRGTAGAMAKVQRNNKMVMPRILELRREGTPHAEIAERLNRDGLRNSRGSLWTREKVSEAIRKYADPSKYTAEELAFVPHGAIQARPKREHNRKIMLEAADRWKAGSSMADIVKHFNAEGKLNSAGRPWVLGHFSAVLRRSLSKEEYAEAKAAHAVAVRGRDDVAMRRILEMKQAGLTQDAMVNRLNSEGYLTSLGRRWNQAKLSRLLAKLHNGSAIGMPPVILYADGKAAKILGLDGKYREKLLGSTSHAKTRRKVLQALLDAGLDGASVAYLRAKIAPGACEVINRLRTDPDWAAVI